MCAIIDSKPELATRARDLDRRRRIGSVDVESIESRVGEWTAVDVQTVDIESVDVEPIDRKAVDGEPVDVEPVVHAIHFERVVTHD